MATAALQKTGIYNGTLKIFTPEVYEPLLYPARYKGAHGGRGSGKSHQFAEMLVERFLAEPATRAVCIREIQKSLEQSVKRLIEDKIAEFGVGSYFIIYENRIETHEGGIILFQGMQSHTADSIKSLEGYDIAWVEEAQTISDFSLTLLRPTIRKPGSELWFTWNPRYATDPIDLLLRGPELPTNACVIEVNYVDNPHFPEVLREEMLFDRARDPEKYAHVWLGKYETRSEARVFKNWTVAEFEAPESPIAFYYGADWGFSVDPTVLIRAWLRDDRTLMIDYEAYSVKCEIDQTPALFDSILCEGRCFPLGKCERKTHAKARSWRIIADSARPETISYMKHHGYPNIVGAKKGTGSIEDGIAFVQKFDVIVHPRCKHVIDELTFYKYKVDEKTNQILPILEDKSNHTIDALRYSVEDMRRPKAGMLW